MSGQVVVVHMAVWGESFVRRAQMYGFASMLAPRNFPLVSRDREIVLEIRTTHEDIARLEGLPEIRDLHNFANIEIIAFTEAAQNANYSDMTAQFLATTRRSSAERAILTYHQPDVIMADGSFASLVDLAREHRAVVGWGSRIQEEGLDVQLERYRDGLALTIPPRELVKLQIANWHSEMLGYRITELITPSLPINLIWQSPDASQALVRAHTMAPLAYNFEKISSDEVEEYIQRLSRTHMTQDHTSTQGPILGDLAGSYLINNSDDFFWTSPTDSQRFATGNPSHSIPSERLSLAATVEAYQQMPWVDKYARYYVTQPIHLRTADNLEWFRSVAYETQEVVTRQSMLGHHQNQLGHHQNQELSKIKTIDFILKKFRILILRFTLTSLILATYRWSVKTTFGRWLRAWMAIHVPNLYSRINSYIRNAELVSY